MTGTVLLLAGCATAPATGTVEPFEVRVEVEETAFPVPAYKVTNNGSGMFWGSGSTQLVRLGDTLYASAFEHVEGCAPLNNARWALYKRDSDGWQLCQRDERERTREPSPLAVSYDGRLLMSTNPTLAPWVDAPPDVSETKMAKRGGDISHKWRGGSAHPEFLEFDPAHPDHDPDRILPQWDGEPKFTEHSYRSFAADGKKGEFIQFQNIGVGHTEWALLMRDGKWASGRLMFPERTVDPAYTPYHGKYARVNYPNVMLRDRAVHFVGHSAYNIWDRVDPAKTETWGRANWGARFRKIHYAYTPDITDTEFTEWVEVDSTMADGGTLTLGDCWLGPDGRVHVVWIKNPIHPRLRDLHFPDIKRDRHLCYGILKEGKLLEKRVLASGGETYGPLWPDGRPRFHITSDGNLYIICYLRGVAKETLVKTGNYALRIARDGVASEPVRIPLERPIVSTLFTPTSRSGSQPSDVAHMIYGDTIDGESVVRYARLRFGPVSTPRVTVRGATCILPGEPRILRLKAVVTDLQKDVETIEWSLPGGTIRHGRKLVWDATDTTMQRYTIDVAATDRAGNVGRARVNVSLPPAELSQSGLPSRIEAEAFVGQGDGEVRICNTITASGTSISYWHKDVGHWLEWDLDVPATGKYELWMRYTTACTGTRRSLLIDGVSPGPEFADIAVPTTGGWSGDQDQWAYLRLGMPIELSAGTHRMRMANLADGLGVDFFVLRPVE